MRKKYWILFPTLITESAWLFAPGPGPIEGLVSCVRYEKGGARLALTVLWFPAGHPGIVDVEESPSGSSRKQ